VVGARSVEGMEPGGVVAWTDAALKIEAEVVGAMGMDALVSEDGVVGARFMKGFEQGL